MNKSNYEITLILQKIEINFAFLSSNNLISFLLKLGNNSQEFSTKTKFIKKEMNLEDKIIKMNTYLQEYEKKRGEFYEKYLEISIFLHSKKGKTRVGLIRIEISNYLKNKTLEINEIINFHKSSEYKGKIFLKMKFNLNDFKEIKKQEKLEGNNDKNNINHNNSNNDHSKNSLNIQNNNNSDFSNNEEENENYDSYNLLETTNISDHSKKEGLIRKRVSDGRINFNKKVTFKSISPEKKNRSMNDYQFENNYNKNFRKEFNREENLFNNNEEIERLKCQIHETDEKYFEKYKENLELKRKLKEYELIVYKLKEESKEFEKKLNENKKENENYLQEKIKSMESLNLMKIEELERENNYLLNEIEFNENSLLKNYEIKIGNLEKEIANLKNEKKEEENFINYEEKIKEYEKIINNFNENKLKEEIILEEKVILIGELKENLLLIEIEKEEKEKELKEIQNHIKNLLLNDDEYEGNYRKSFLLIKAKISNLEEQILLKVKENENLMEKLKDYYNSGVKNDTETQLSTKSASICLNDNWNSIDFNNMSNNYLIKTKNLNEKMVKNEEINKNAFSELRKRMDVLKLSKEIDINDKKNGLLENEIKKLKMREINFTQYINQLEEFNKNLNCIVEEKDEAFAELQFFVKKIEKELFYTKEILEELINGIFDNKGDAYLKGIIGKKFNVKQKNEFDE